MIKLRCKMKRGHLSIIGCYSPEEGRKEVEKFYEQLQDVDKVLRNDYLFVPGDLNARV